MIDLLPLLPWEVAVQESKGSSFPVRDDPRGLHWKGGIHRLSAEVKYRVKKRPKLCVLRNFCEAKTVLPCGKLR